MNFSCLSAEEVRTRYRQAADKNGIIAVLADLTCSSKAEMRRFLGVEKPRRKTPIELDREKAMEYYEAGMSDEEIAQRLGVVKCTVCHWRLSTGLACNADSEKARMELYEQGLNDQEIGDALRLSSEAIWHWRKRLGLPSNTGRGQYDRKKKKG